jgi:hypothetical protein
MKRNSVLLTALLLASGTAMAQYQLEAIQVRPTNGNEITFSCDSRITPKAIDVEALLQIHDRTQTQQLTNKLMGAVGEACARGIPSIVVERGKQGSSVIWYPVAGYPTASVPYPETVVYPESTTISYPAGTVFNADGSVTYPDGTTVYPDE